MMFAPGVLVLSALLSLSLLAALAMLVTELRGEPAPTRGDDKTRAETSTLLSASRIPYLGRAKTVVRTIAAVLVGAVVAWGTGWPVAAIACAVLVLAWPAVSGGRRAENREIGTLDAVLTWTQGLRDTVAGGASLEQAIGVSVEGAEPALRPSLEQVRSRMLVRHPLDVALEPLQAVPGADFVVAALTLAARRRGDRLPDVLSGIVTTCAHEVAQRRQILAARAGIHRSVQIIMAVTVAILTWMATVGAAYMSPYDGVAGQGVLAIVIGILAAGFLWLIRLDITTSAPAFLASAALTNRQNLIIATLATPSSTASRDSDATGARGPTATSGWSGTSPRPASWRDEGDAGRRPSDWDQAW